SMRIIQSFKGVVICSAIISVCCAISGMLVSILFSTPVGSTIVVANIIIFFISCSIEKILRR
ncbi:MAG: metal ABC transporter permease, partial [Cellulosilyticum sp.]|nr:metal ABC transporter permease [Cellulosilyticum sp.]